MNAIRRIAFVCMTPEIDANEHEGADLPSYGIHRILASVAADPALQHCQLGLIDMGQADVEAYVRALVSFEPDLIGFSVYVWSTPCLIEVARRFKELRPNCTIVFGGPSARTKVFDVYPNVEPHECLDAVVSAEGEMTFREIARLSTLDHAHLATVGGLDLATPDGWHHTGARTPIRHLDDIPSPFQMSMMRRNSVAYLETYRGCPLGCRFCEWGASDSPKTVFSAEYLMRELHAFAVTSCPSVFLLDAGLNLNARAFRNLVAAEREVGFLRSAGLWAEIYPSHVRDEHLEFLETVGTGYLGIGLQSRDPAVLKNHDRPWDQDQFEQSVRQLAEVAFGEIQIIFGLPTDSPAGFLETLAFARSLPVGVRAYHCLVLPDALLTRSKPDWNVQFDPVTLEMHRCTGWTYDAILEMREYLIRETTAAGGKSGDYWFYFPNPKLAQRKAS
ncbi:MAG: radical SAM protein [Planctomycetales bacterium]|nr:radical SAM protein [Planctomycetales bacterium]